MQMPVREREAMSAQALATFDARYDMRKNAVTIIRLFEAAVPPEKRIRMEVEAGERDVL